MDQPVTIDRYGNHDLTLAKNRVLVTCVRNILDPYESRETMAFPAGYSLRHYLTHFFPSGWGEEYDLVISESGHSIENPDLDAIVIGYANYSFAIVPQGGGGGLGKVVMAVGLIALTIATYGATAGIAGMTMGEAFGMGIGGLGLIAIGAGMMAFNLTMDGFSPDSKSATYSWDNAKNYNQEGGTWPVLYGVMRVTAPVLSKTLTANGGTQQLNILYCVADHACDSLQLVEINETPAANFDSNVTFTTDRLGSTSQAVVPGFQDTISDVQVGVKLTPSWTERRTTGNSLNALAVELVMPRGLFHVADNGSLESTTCYFIIDYKLVADTEWTRWQTVQLVDKTSSTLRYYYRKDDLTPGQYDIRVCLNYTPPTGTRYANDLYWEMFQEIVYDDFTYPGATLLGVHALPTESLNGSMPKTTVVATRSTVQVWTGAAYESKPANNPAWACYDLLHNAEYGGDVPYSRIIYADFLAWATFCTTNSYTCNVYFDTVCNLRKALDTISLLGRGHVVQRGSKYSVIIDQAIAAPVQGFLFTQANIIEDSFNQEWIGNADRANVLEITYWDANENYSKQTFQMYASDFETTTEEVRVKDIQLVGCTNRDMAIKYGKYVLNTNRYLTMKCAWSADVDSIGCVPGDIVELAHDVPQWGFSGRVVSSTNNTVTLDQYVTMEPATEYRIVVRHDATDVREEKVLASVLIETETNVLTLASGTWSTNPAKYTNYSFGETAHVTKLVRITQIGKEQNLRRNIRAIEYNANVYSDTATIGIIESESSFVGVSNLRAEEIYIPGRDNVGISYVLLIWRGVALKWNVYVMEEYSTTWKFLETVTTPQYRVKNLAPGQTYQFSVSEGDNPGVYTTSLAYTGAPSPPVVPTGLTTAVVGEAIQLTWTETDSVVDIGYNIYLNDVLIAANVYGNRYIYYGSLTNGNYVFKIRAVDIYGQESTAYDDDTTTISVPLTPDASYTSNNETVTITWQDCKSSLPIAYYLINRTEKVYTTTYLIRVNWTGAQTFYITAYDVAGNASSEESITITITAITAVTNITATGMTYAIRLNLTYNTFNTISAVEVWSSTVNDRSGATKAGETASTTFTHGGRDLIETRYYWTRIRDIYGSYGAWYPLSATGGFEASTSTDPADYLVILDESISESQLVTSLNDRIDWIDTQAYVFGEEYVVQGTFYGMNGCLNAFNQCLTGHDEEITTAQVDIDTANAAILLRATQADLDAAEARISTAESDIDAGEAGTWASISSKATTAALSAVDARVTQAESDITAGQAGTWGSISDRLLISSYSTDQKVGGYLRIAAMENRMSVYDTENAPTWNAGTTYYPGTIVVNDGLYYRAIKQNMNSEPPNGTYWTAISAGLVAQWTMKMDVNGHVAGIGMALDGSGNSEFAIVTNKFSVVNPNISNPTTWSETGSYTVGDYVLYQTNGHYYKCIQTYTYPPGRDCIADTDYWHEEVVAPFVIGDVNGISTVGINGNLVVDGSILARHIAAESITADLYKELRQTLVFTGDDSLDATYPYELPFKIPSELCTNGIVSIKVSFKIMPFRGYTMGADDGGASTSGPTSTEHTHTIPIVGSLSTSEWQVNWNFQYGRLTTGPGGWGGAALPSSSSSSTDHTHTTPDHTHGIVFGIYEEDNSPTVHFKVDNGSGYGNESENYTDDAIDVDITSQISGTGWKSIKFETTARCRISVIVECKVDIDA